MTWVSSSLARWRTTRAVRILVREAGGRGKVSFCAQSTFPFLASTMMPSSTPSGAGIGSPFGPGGGAGIGGGAGATLGTVRGLDAGFGGGGFRAGAASAEAGAADPASAARTRRSTEKRREVFIAWGSVRDRDCQIKNLDRERLAEFEKCNARNSFLLAQIPPGELQQGRVEVLAAQACRCEQVADLLDALEGGCDGELLRQDLLLELLPGQRHRHRRPRVGPDRVRGDEGLALGVLVGVDEYVALAAGDRGPERGLLRVHGRDEPSDAQAKLTDLGVRVAGQQREEDLQPGSARGLGEAGEAQPLQGGVDQPPPGPHVVEGDGLEGVEVDDREVG